MVSTKIVAGAAALFFLAAIHLFAADYGKNGMAVGLCGSNTYITGDMSEFALCAVGGGASFTWKIPAVPFLGLSARLEGGGMVPKTNSINSWWQILFTGGVWADFPFGKIFALRPELSYGVWAHNIVSPEKNINGFFTDQIIQLAGGLRFTLPSTKFTLELAPLFFLLTEKSYVVYQTGYRLGVYYAF